MKNWHTVISFILVNWWEKRGWVLYTWGKNNTVLVCRLAMWLICAFLRIVWGVGKEWWKDWDRWTWGGSGARKQVYSWSAGYLVVWELIQTGVGPYEWLDPPRIVERERIRGNQRGSDGIRVDFVGSSMDPPKRWIHAKPCLVPLSDHASHWSKWECLRVCVWLLSNLSRPPPSPPPLSLSFYMPSALFLYTLLSLWFPLILSLYDSGWIQPLIRPGLWPTLQKFNLHPIYPLAYLCAYPFKWQKMYITFEPIFVRFQRKPKLMKYYKS